MDRTTEKLVIYKKDGTKVSEGEVGKLSASITGLTAGTKVAAGDYQCSFSDGTKESDKVDIPAFDVPADEGGETAKLEDLNKDELRKKVDEIDPDFKKNASKDELIAKLQA